MRGAINHRSVRIPFLASLTCFASLLTLAPFALGADAAPKSTPTKTIAFALTDVWYGLYETPDGKEECPNGLQAGEVAQYKAMPDHDPYRKKFGGTFELRGPNGERTSYSPMAVTDPLPWNEYKTKHGFGVNLDGTSDGHATAKTCKHEKFTSPEGEQIDNQMARVVGCVKGFRNSGLTITFYRSEIPNFTYNRLLIEVSGVHDEQNDPNVQVTIYKGIDPLVRTAGGDTFVPFTSQRIDERFPQYTYKTHGKIVDGILTTDPIATANLPIRETGNIGVRQMHDLTYRLKLTADGAEGVFAGYQSVFSWYNIESKSVTPELDQYSPAGLYRAAHRYADGYPDPKTGECTYISSTYNVKAVRVMIVHPTHQRGPSPVAQSANSPVQSASAQ